MQSRPSQKRPRKKHTLHLYQASPTTAKQIFNLRFHGWWLGSRDIHSHGDLARRSAEVSLSGLCRAEASFSQFFVGFSDFPFGETSGLET